MNFPCNQSIENFIDLIKGYLFDDYFPCDDKGQKRLKFQLQEILSDVIDDEDELKKHTDEIFNQIINIKPLLIDDAQAAYDGDPAANSIAEIVICYPGWFAIFVHRIANLFYKREIALIPRMLSEYAHSKTGIDISPGATIGSRFFIDHGTGVVIGETVIIGKNVKIYQGVTLGALSTKGGQRLKNIKRHPTIEDNVTIYAYATILGGETIIGANSVIGGNCFIIESIEPNSKVMHQIK